MAPQIDTNDFPLKEECYEVIGCAMEVRSELGCGFLEPVYQEALSVEFQESGIPFHKEARLDLEYKGIPLQKKYIADFICYNQLIVELKATNFRVGLLLNFGTTKLQYKRVIL